jgi:hypothetical protein
MVNEIRKIREKAGIKLLEEIRTMTEIKDYSILGCDTGSLYMLLPTLQRNTLYSS